MSSSPYFRDRKKTTYLIRWSAVDTSYRDDGNRTAYHERICDNIDQLRQMISVILATGHIMYGPVVERLTRNPLSERDKKDLGLQFHTRLERVRKEND